MINIASITSLLTEKIECDGYTPFQITFGSWTPGLDVAYTWRATDEKSLFDLSINAKSGEVIGMNLVLIPSNWIKENDCPQFNDIKSQSGIPVFSLSEFIGNKEFPGRDETRIDHEIPFRLCIDSERAILSFPSVDDTQQLFQNDRVYFGVSKRGELSCVIIDSLSDKELESIRWACGLE